MTDAPTTVVKLGDFDFRRYEIPEAIPFGGEQDLVIQKLIGGERSVDAMGASPEPLQWTGRFQGEGALQRALVLDGMRKAGKSLVLTWSELSFLVVIKKLICSFERSYQLPYSIVLEVVKDLAAPVGSVTSTSLDDQMLTDMDNANGLGDEIDDAPLSGLLSTMDTAVRKVSNFATATQKTLNTVLAPLAAVKARVGTLIASVDNTLLSVTTLGGVVPNNPASQVVASFSNQLVAMEQSPRLYGLASVLDRMETNIAADGVAGSTVTVAGGSLYKLAAEAYGDINGWTTLARANGMLDPVLVGIQTIRVPPSEQINGGVLEA